MQKVLWPNPNHAEKWRGHGHGGHTPEA